MKKTSGTLCVLAVAVVNVSSASKSWATVVAVGALNVRIAGPIVAPAADLNSPAGLIAPAFLSQSFAVPSALIPSVVPSAAAKNVKPLTSAKTFSEPGITPGQLTPAAASKAAGIIDAARRFFDVKEVETVAAAPEIRPVPVFDRAALSSKVIAEVSRRRAVLIADIDSPRYVRFSMPKTKAYAEALVAKLLAGSHLEALANGPDGILVRLNDTSWSKPGARMSGGILTLEPEMIAIMDSEDEVAAVAAHEIAHYLRAHDEQLVAARPWYSDLFKSRSRDIFDAPPMPSRREMEARWKHEFEADALSLRLLVNAGYDPSAAISSLLAIQNERNTEPLYEFDRGLADPMHPSVEARLDALREAMAREDMAAARRSSQGLPEIYQELAGRRRSLRPEDIPASEQYQQYKRPKFFVP